MRHSTAPAARNKRANAPAKLPIYKHATGRWCKKIKGNLYYFGKIEGDENGQAALARYLAEKDTILLTGRKPKQASTGVKVGDACNLFLAAKESLVESGEIGKQHWSDYARTCKRIIEEFGRYRAVADLRVDDFAKMRSKYAVRWNASTLAGEIQRVRSVFKWLFDAEIIETPIRFGPLFAKPSRKVQRVERKAAGVKLFTAHEIRSMYYAAGSAMKAAILLGINCGFGNTDIATLPIDRLDLDGGWHRFERLKTGTDRRAPLWPETIEALRAVLAKRPTPKVSEAEALVFVTKYGRPWLRMQETKNGDLGRIDSVSLEFAKLQRKVKCHRLGIRFYTLRRTHRTVSDEVGDQPAANLIMGHTPDERDMSSIYRQRISDDRLRKVTDYVRDWLFPSPTVEKEG